jgi:hypothetical protein
MSGVLTSGPGKAPNLRDNTGDEGEVQAFLNQVQHFLNAGTLTPAQAAALLGPGNLLLLNVTRRQSPVAARGVVRAAAAPRVSYRAGLAEESLVGHAGVSNAGQAVVLASLRTASRTSSIGLGRRKRWLISSRKE